MIHMEMTANTHADTVTTMPPVTEIMKRVRMGVEKVMQEVTVNSVSFSKPLNVFFLKLNSRIFIHKMHFKNIFIDWW